MTDTVSNLDYVKSILEKHITNKYCVNRLLKSSLNLKRMKLDS